MRKIWAFFWYQNFTKFEKKFEAIGPGSFKGMCCHDLSDFAHWVCFVVILQSTKVWAFLAHSISVWNAFHHDMGIGKGIFSANLDHDLGDVGI